MDDSQSMAAPLIIGGGPAGLTAALTLAEAGHRVRVVEAGTLVGGIARTESYKGYRFDIGGHRFFTKVGEVRDLWKRIMGDDFIRVPRLSRIYYDGKYYDYPLSITNTLRNLGPVESIRIGLSYVRWRVFPHRREDNLEQWVTNRFGQRLFNRFFKTYTEKVWGLPCSSIQADWAAQRIKDLSLIKAVTNAITGRTDTTSLIDRFDYPRLGPGMMWERFRDILIDMDSTVDMQTRADRLHHRDGHVHSVTLTDGDGLEQETPVSAVINSMPLARLIEALDPPAPDHVLAAAQKLKYRDFLIVVLIVDQADPFPDNWIYIHSPEVKVGRIQNFRSWSAEMVPDPNRASIGLEYFCHEGDGVWNMSTDELVALAKEELGVLGLVDPAGVVDGTVIRQPKAYPVYDEEYRDAVDVLATYLGTFDNLQSVGRNGMHRYNNQDHSMLTAILAAKNLMGETHDIWNVNVERSYHENFVTADKSGKATAADEGAVDKLGTAVQEPAGQPPRRKIQALPTPQQNLPDGNTSANAGAVVEGGASDRAANEAAIPRKATGTHGAVDSTASKRETQE